MKFLQDYVAREEVERIVVGEPRQMNGKPSENLQRVRQFVAQWKKTMPSIPVEYYDERFTSVLAHRAMIDSGIGKKARQNKALVDEISATIILQDYLNSRRGGNFDKRLGKKWQNRISSPSCLNKTKENDQ